MTLDNLYEKARIYANELDKSIKKYPSFSEELDEIFKRYSWHLTAKIFDEIRVVDEFDLEIRKNIYNMKDMNLHAIEMERFQRVLEYPREPCGEDYSVYRF